MTKLAALFILVVIGLLLLFLGGERLNDERRAFGIAMIACGFMVCGIGFWIWSASVFGS